ncbi:MAG: cytidylate kinase [Thermomicrobiales bacterium]|nr:MAG: cytidylate kinase [Thermomicrobiales bacterium]
MSSPANAGEARPKPSDHCTVIAIDGPAAAGKTTIARALARRLNATYLDTGALYRAVTLAALREGVPIADGERIARLARSLAIRILPPAPGEDRERILLDGEDVTEAIRGQEVDAVVSKVAAIPEVRAALLPIQRDLASKGHVVLAGRDITTVVVPDAGVRIYLNASPEERARRRYLELQSRGCHTDYETVLREIRQRDLADMSRPVAPLRAAPGVTIVETDGRTISEIVEEIAQLALRVWKEQCGERGTITREST